MNQERVLIIGTHPLCHSVRVQFEERGYHTDCQQELLPEMVVDDYDELCLLPSCGASARQTDEATLCMLQEIASKMSARERRCRPLCHTLLHSQVTLWLLQNVELLQDVNRCLELYAFTMEDQWAKNLLCGMQRGEHRFPPLDREPLGLHSTRFVHLVIAGWSDMTESLAIHAALTAHYPNYVQDSQLRTRITIIASNIEQHAQAFRQRYRHLMDNSYYRIVDACRGTIVTLHRPMYSGQRDDFVDVEWEFVEGDLHVDVIRRKLELWSGSTDQLFTMVLSQSDSDRNFDEALSLPAAVYDARIPVMVYTHEGRLMQLVHQTERYANVYPFGMDDCGYDTRLPLLQMAKRLNYFYYCSYHQQTVPTSMPQQEIDDAWVGGGSFSMRYSNIYNVMTIPCKMRSVGHDESDWDRFYALSQEEIEVISAVEHNRWSVERLILGFRPPTSDERQEIKENIALKDNYKRRKIHYDLCSYAELGVDKTGQNVRVYDYDLTACIPLIANSYREESL